MSDVGQEIISSVRRHAAAKPDFVYDHPDGGAYVRGGRPSCLIGWALWELGFIDASFEDGPFNNGALRYALENDCPELGLLQQMDQDEVSWLHSVQRRQDLETPWGEAVARMDQEFPLS